MKDEDLKRVIRLFLEEQAEKDEKQGDRVAALIVRAEATAYHSAATILKEWLGR